METSKTKIFVIVIANTDMLAAYRYFTSKDKAEVFSESLPLMQNYWIKELH